MELERFSHWITVFALAKSFIQKNVGLNFYICVQNLNLVPNSSSNLFAERKIFTGIVHSFVCVKLKPNQPIANAIYGAYKVKG